MCPRRYDMGERTRKVERTRRRILDAAIGLFGEEGFQGTSVSRIAERADVTRATVYHHFDTKLGLIEALVADAADSAGLAEILHLGENAETDGDVRELLDAYTRFWASHEALFRNVIGLAGVDPEAAAVVEARDENRRRGMESLASRLGARGTLASGVSEADASQTLWLLTSFPVFDQLHRRSRLETEDVARILARLTSTLFADPAHPSADTPGLLEGGTDL